MDARLILAKNLDMLMKHHGYNQPAVVRLSRGALHQRTVSRALNNIEEDVKLATIVALAAVFKIQARKLLDPNLKSEYPPI